MNAAATLATGPRRQVRPQTQGTGAAHRATLMGAACALVVGTLLSLSIGESRIPLADVARTLLGAGDPFTELIVMEFRAPRVATGALVGLAFGLAGAVLQSIARNPLASPDILGINAGAAVAAVSIVVLAGSDGGVSGVAASVGLPVAALLGAIASGLLLWALAVRGRQLDPMRLVVVGVGISAAGASLVSWMLTLGDIIRASAAITWLSGSLHTASWSRAVAVVAVVALVLPLLVVRARQLDLLVLGDDLAGGLGVPVDRTRTILLLVTAVLTGAATSAAGAIAFVALCAPQLARGLARTARPPLLASGLVGAAGLVWADLLARQLLSWLGFGPIELPVGIVTAVLGAPYLLYVVARGHRTKTGGDLR